MVDGSVIVIERDGNGGAIAQSPGLLTAMNFDTYNIRTITCATSFGANTRLHDYTGRHGDIWTDWQGNSLLSPFRRMLIVEARAIFAFPAHLVTSPSFRSRGELPRSSSALRSRYSAGQVRGISSHRPHICTGRD